MDSFYVVLPSNTTFPGNTISQFIVKLPNIIDLSDGNWGVALSSIIYPLTFSGVEDEEKITIDYEHGASQEIIIPRRIQYNSIKDFERTLNDIILTANFDASLDNTKSDEEKKRSKRDAQPKTVDQFLSDITEAVNRVKKIKTEIEQKINDIDDGAIKNTIMNEINEVVEKAKSLEWVSRVGKVNLDQMNKLNNFEQAKKFANEIRNLRDRFLVADGKEKSIQQKAEAILAKLLNEIDNRKKKPSVKPNQTTETSIKSAGNEKDLDTKVVDKYLQNISEAFEAIKRMKNEIEQKTIVDEELKLAVKPIMDEFNGIWEKARSTDWLARAGKGHFAMAVQAKNIEQANKFSKQIGGMKDKFLGVGKEKGFKELAQEFRNRIVNEIERLTKQKQEKEQKTKPLEPSKPEVKTSSTLPSKTSKPETKPDPKSVEKQATQPQIPQKQTPSKAPKESQPTPSLSGKPEAKAPSPKTSKPETKPDPKAVEKQSTLKPKQTPPAVTKESQPTPSLPGKPEVKPTASKPSKSEIKPDPKPGEKQLEPKQTPSKPSKESQPKPSLPQPGKLEALPPGLKTTKPETKTDEQPKSEGKETSQISLEPKEKESKLTPALPRKPEEKTPKEQPQPSPTLPSPKPTVKPEKTENKPAPKPSPKVTPPGKSPAKMVEEKPKAEPRGGKPSLKPLIAFAQESAPIEPPPPPRIPTPPPPPDQRPIAKPRGIEISSESTNRPIAQRRKLLSDEEQKNIDTAKRVTSESILAIEDAMVVFEKYNTEANKTVENMNKKFGASNANDPTAKKYMDVISANYETITSINLDAHKKYDAAKVAEGEVITAHNGKNVKRAEEQTQIIKRLKHDIVEKLKPQIEDARELMFTYHGRLLEWEEESKLKQKYAQAGEVLREVEKAYSAIRRTHDNLLDAKKELDEAKLELNSEGDNLKDVLLEKIESGNNLLATKVQPKYEKAVGERIALEEAMVEKKGDVLDEIIKRLRSYHSEFLGDDENIGFKREFMNTGNEVTLKFVHEFKPLISRLQESKLKEAEKKQDEKPAVPSKPTTIAVKPSEPPSEKKPSMIVVKPSEPQSEKASPEATLSAFDDWPIPEMFKKIKEPKKMTKYTEPRTSIPDEMKIALDKADQWPTIQKQQLNKGLEKQEAQMMEKRREELKAYVHMHIDMVTKIGKNDNVKRNDYQEIYYHYDDEQIHRFFLWASNDPQFGITNVKLSKQLAYVLGFETDRENNVKLNSFAKYAPDITPMHSFYVYAPNLVANTVIGDTYGPLLRIVNVRSSSTEKIAEIIYSPENFIQVLQKHISEIRIEILSDSGRPIEFNSGNCIVTLHFKRSLF